MDGIKYWIWLNSIPELGPVRIKKLLEYFSVPENIWNASNAELDKVEGIGPVISKIISKNKNLDNIEKELNNIQRNNIKVVTIEDEQYPYNLKNIYDSPILLYYKGEILSQDNNSVAIVGSRNATQYGLNVAYELGRKLASAGLTVVSGMARGIDTATHRGALDAGGRTVAVLGSGLDYIYPAENKKLYNEIVGRGAVISEYSLGTIPDPKHFPQRNRIISGISLGVTVVEANKKSGSLITVDFALEQNREVFAVPGPISSKSSQGTNELIKQGAKIVTCVEDILEELNLNNLQISDETIKTVNEISDLDGEEKIIYSQITQNPIHLDNIIKHTGFTISKLNTIITLLELKGLIKQLPGKQFVRI